MYRGYFVPKVVDPTGRLSVSHRNPDCSNCGDGSITWTLLTEPKKREFYAIQKICFRFFGFECNRDESNCCKRSPKIYSCETCIFEWILEKTPIRDDGWELKNVIRKSPKHCGTKGFWLIHAEIKTFPKEAKKNIPRDLFWRDEGEIRCGTLGKIKVGKHKSVTATDSKWWNGDDVIETHHSVLAYSWDCCSKEKRGELTWYTTANSLSDKAKWFKQCK